MSRTCNRPCRAALLAACLVVTALAVTPAGAVPNPYYDDLGVVPWRASWPAAVQEAQALGKPLFILLTQENSARDQFLSTRAFPARGVRNLLRRFFVCVAFDRKLAPPPVDKLCQNHDIVTLPICLFVTPKGDLLKQHQGGTGADDFEKNLRPLISDPRLAAAKGKEKELDRLAQELARAVEARDAKKIQTTFQAIERIPGLSPAKGKAYATLDQAEDQVWEKLTEAAKAVREHKYPLARVALEEAQRLAEHLPVARDVRQAQAALPLVEQAGTLEKTRAGRWKEKAAADYQRVLRQHPESLFATVAQLRLRALPAAK